MNDPQSLEELPDLETFTSIVKGGEETPEQKNFLLQKFQDTALELARGDETINSPRQDGENQIPVSDNYDSFSNYVISGINKAKSEINRPRASEIHTRALKDKYGDEAQYQEAAKAVNDYAYFGGPPTDAVIEDLELAQRAFREEVNYSGVSNQTGSLNDSVGNPLANFNVLYNSKKQPEYVRISLNNEGVIFDDPQTADLVKFPKDFNPVDNYVDSLKSKRDELKGSLDSNAILLDGPYWNIEEKEKIAEIQTLDNQIRIAEQLIAAKNQSFIDDATQKGVDSYVQDYIRNQARNGDPKYQNIGNNLLEGAASTVWGGIRRAGTFLQGADYAIQEQSYRAVSAVEEALGFSEQAATDKGYANLLNQARADLSAKSQKIASEQRFSGLEVTNPYAGELLRDISDAVYQGSESIATSAAGYVVGGPAGAVLGATGYSFLQAAGSKSLELSALEKQRRQEGDLEGADYIRNNQGYLSILRGATEALTERFSPGDVAFGSLSRGRRVISRFSGEVAGEGLEEGASGLADAFQGFYLEGKSAEETAEAVSGLPKDVLMGAVGAVLPVSIRTLRGSLRNTSDQVDREVVKEVVKKKLEKVETVAQEQGISKEEAAKVVLNNRDEAINAANEYIRTFEGNLGDNPKPSITSNLEQAETETAPIEQAEGTPEFSFTTGESVDPFLQEETFTETSPTTDEVLEVGLDALGEDAPIPIKTKPQSTSEASPAQDPQDIEQVNNQIASLVNQEQIQEEISTPIRAMTPQEARDVASFVVSGLQLDSQTNSYKIPQDADGKPTLGSEGVSIVADIHGNQRLIPTQELISGVNSGNIDPNVSLFYIPQQLRENPSRETQLFLDAIPSRNISTFNPDEVGIKFWEQQSPQQQTQEGEQAQAAEGEISPPAETPQITDANRVIAYAAQLKRRGNQAIADMLVDRAISPQDQNERKRENNNQNNQLFSPGGNENPQYYFNGVQNDLDGNPFLDLYTINDESHPYNGSTISVPHGSTSEQVAQAIENKRDQRFSPEGRSLDDSFARLQSGVTLAVPSFVESLSESQDRLIANTAAILRELPNERVANVQVSRDNSEPRSYYQRPTTKEPAKIVLGRNTSESTLMHEIMHAYTDPLIDQEIGAALDAADTGVKYKQALDDYLKSGKNIKLKIVLENYITIVNALGYADDVFGEKKRDISKWNGDPLHYGLQDIREFCSELITEPALAERINAIKNPYQESLFKRLIRAILDFFQSTLLKGYSPFFNKTFADLIVFINDGEVLSPYETDLVRRNPPSLNTQLSKYIQQAYELSSSDTLTQDQRGRLSSLNHQKANASPAIKDTTVYVRPITRDELLNIRRIESLRSDTAIDVTLESTVGQMIPEGLALIWDEKANGGSFVSVLNDGSLSSEDIDKLKKRGIDVITEQERLYMKAYHGTPHKISDSFKLNKIGSGEGAQAYGWGLYFAANRAVAEQYQRNLGPGKGAGVADTAQRILDAVNGDVGKALDTVATRRRGANMPDAQEFFDQVEAALRTHAGLSNLYTVELNVEDGDLLDWDKPLSEQSDQVRAALAGVLKDIPYQVEEDWTGGEIYKGLGDSFTSGIMGGDESPGRRQASERLASLGIPGIRYLDGQSRGSGDGSYNYVIWDESKIKIIEENDAPFIRGDNGILYSKESESAGEKRMKPKKTRELEGVVFNESFLTPSQKRRLTTLRKQLENGKVPSEFALEEITEIKQASDAAEFSYLKMEYPEALSGKDIDNLSDAQVAVIDWLEDNPEDPRWQDIAKKTKARVQKVIEFRDMVIALRDGDFTDFNSIQDQRIKGLVEESIDFMLNNFNPESVSSRQLTAWTKALRLFIESNGRNISGFARTAAKISTSKIVGELENAKRNVAGAFNESPDIKIFGMPISDMRRGKSKFISTKDILEPLADVSSELDAIFNRKDTRNAIYRILSDYHTSLNDFHILEDDLLTRYKERIESIQDRYRSRGAPTLLDDSKIQIAKRVTQFEIGAEATPLQQIRNNLGEEQESIRRKLSVLKDQRMLDEGRIDQQAFDEIAQPLLDAIDNDIITDEQDAVAFIENTLDNYQLEILKLVREPGDIYWNQLDAVNQLSVGIPGSTRRQMRPWANYAKRSQRPLRTEDFTSFSGEAGFNSALSVMQPRMGLGGTKNNVFTSSWQSDLEQQLTETAYEITTGPARVQLFQAFRSDQMVQVLDDGATNAPRTDRMKEQLGNIHTYTRNNDLKAPALAQAALSVASYAMALNLVSPHQPANQMIPVLLYNLQHPASIARTVISRMMFGRAKKAQDDFIQKYSPDLHNRMKHYEQLLEKGKTSSQRRAVKTGLRDLDTLGREFSRLAFRLTRPVKNVADALASFPIHLAVGTSETFSAKSVFLSLYADELTRRGLISDPTEFLSGDNMIYDRAALTFAELELDRYTLAPLRQANRGEAWQRTHLGKEIVRVGAYSLARTAIQQSIKSTTAARDLLDAARDAARVRNPQSLEHVKEKTRELSIQLFQNAFYYVLRAASMKMMLNLGSASTFIVAAAIEGSDDDKEKWMRHYRNLFRIYSGDQEKFLFQQYLTDQLYTIMPFGIIQNNIARGAVNGFFEMMRSWPFNVKELEETKKELQAQQKQVNEQIKAYEKLGQTDKAIELDIAREYVEHALLEADNNLKNMKHALRNFADNVTGEILPATAEVRSLANYFDDLGLPNDDPVYQNVIEQAKNNNAWWAISAMLGIANPARKAADRTIKAKAAADAQAAKSEERRYNEAIDDLNEVNRVKDIQVPEEFSATVPPRFYE